MSVLDRLLQLKRKLFQNARLDEDQDQEIRSYLDLLTHEKIRLGMGPEEARRAALVEVGGVEQVKEECRDVRSFRWLEALLKDMQYATRMLRKNPAFAALSVLTIALCIGANTALFTIVNAAFLRPLPFQHPEHLVGLPDGLSPAALREVKGGTQTLAAAAGFVRWRWLLSSKEETRDIMGFRVSAQLFDVLGVRPLLGRSFSRGEDQPAAGRAVILSYAFWRSMGGTPQLIGQTIILDGEPHTVIGVLPPAFWLAFQGSAVWVPLHFSEEELHASGFTVRALARLRPGRTIAQARAELASLERHVEANERTDHDPPVMPLADELRAYSVRILPVLQGAVGLLLLIGCADVTSLLLVRLNSRRHEFAIRASLGASRGQITRQLLAEGLLLAALGGLLGLGLAWTSVDVIQQILQLELPLADDQTLAMDYRVLSFTAAISLLTLLLCSLAPLWSLSRHDLSIGLKASGRTTTPTAGQQRAMRFLVAGEIAICLALLAGAGLVTKSLFRVLHADLGFKSAHVLRYGIQLPDHKYPNQQVRSSIFDQVAHRLEAIPGVQSVGLSDYLMPVSGSPTAPGDTLTIEGRTAPSHGSEPRAHSYSVDGNYFHVLHIPLLRGRLFTSRDDGRSTPVAIISQSLAQDWLPGEDPVGKRFRLEGAQPEGPWLSIVGVVGDVRHPLAVGPQPTVYLSYRQGPPGFSYFMIQTAVDPASLLPAVRHEARSLNRDFVEVMVGPLEHTISDLIGEPRASAQLITMFAAVAFLMAMLGVYGVTHYWVTQRFHDIGVRVALGASRMDIVNLVVGRAARLAASGIVLGLALTVGLTRLVSSQLHGISPTDPATLVEVSAFLAAVSLAASYLPARRATQSDPVVALRHE